LIYNILKKENMTHLDTELQSLKESILEMWKLIQLQQDKTKHAFITSDKDLAREILANERRVNAFELKMDRDCENILALFNPLAVDLRFVLAVLKINSCLERIGDMAEGISRYVVDAEGSYDNELIQKTQILEMFDLSAKMLDDIIKAFETEDTKLARTIFKNDERLDQINVAASAIITGFIKDHPEHTMQSLDVLSMIHKLERVGDYCKNIAEEIIFFIEAKILKHNRSIHKKSK
jgi:phosphate transport system protein